MSAKPSTSLPSPTIVLVGLPNAGKSTLFNRLCGGRRALMSEVPGTTRDWQEGVVDWNGRSFRAIDTGGYDPGVDGVLTSVRERVQRWIADADVVVWVADGTEGLLPADQALASWMRSRAKKVIVAVNKIDDASHEHRAAEFHRLGFPEVIPISSSHGRGIHVLLEKIEEALFPDGAAPEAVPDGTPPPITVALVGRPNVGKSSTLNAILGEDRMIVSPIPGTTRDAVDTPFEKDGKKFLFIDTAGLRASTSNASQGLEGLTRIMAEKALERTDVAILLIDASEGIRDGDVAVGRLIEMNKRACVLGVNKWDLVTNRSDASRRLREHHADDLPFLTHAPIVFYSAKTGQNLGPLLDAAAATHEAFHRYFEEEELSAFFWREVQERPYSHRGRKLVFHRAVQAGTAPTKIVLRCNLTAQEIHFSYLRRLENAFRKRYGHAGAPLILTFKRGKR